MKTKKARVINAAWHTGGGVFHISYNGASI